MSLEEWMVQKYGPGVIQILEKHKDNIQMIPAALNMALREEMEYFEFLDES